MDLEHQALQAQVEINDIERRITHAVNTAMLLLQSVYHLLVDKYGNEKASDLRGALREQIEDAFYEPLQERRDITRAADAAQDEAHEQGVRQDYLTAQMGSVQA